MAFSQKPQLGVGYLKRRVTMADEQVGIGENDILDDVLDDIFDDDVTGTDDAAEAVETEEDAEAGPKPEIVKEAPAPAKPKGKPGRPRTYTDEQRAEFATMIEQHGLSGTVNVLAAHTGMTIDDMSGQDDIEKRANLERNKLWAVERNQDLFPADKSFSVSLPTLSSVAKEAGISLQKGRRKA
jgi:transposase